MVADLLRAAAHLLSFPGAQHLQNVHPLIVHFPIALLFAATLIYWLGVFARRESWLWSGLWMLVLGALGAGAATATGLYAAPGVMLAPSVKTVLLASHKRMMIAVAILSAALALWAIAAFSPRAPTTAAGWCSTIMPAATRAASRSSSASR